MVIALAIPNSVLYGAPIVAILLFAWAYLIARGVR